MKKFLPYLILIVVLAGAGAWFFLHKSEGTIAKEESQFAYAEGNKITHIRLSPVNKPVLDLVRKGKGWIVNGKYEAREDLVAQLLDAVTRMDALCPAPKAAHDNIMKEILEQGVKTEIYTAEDEKPVRVYYVGGPTLDARNTHLIMEVDGKMASKPYLVYVPGFRGYITGRFNTNEENWRSRKLFANNSQDIQSLQVEYPGEDMNSFSITRLAADSFQLSPGDEKYRIAGNARQEYIRQYLDFYSALFIEAFDNQYSKRDSLLGTVPYCSISLQPVGAETQQVKIYHMPLSKRSKNQVDGKGISADYDVDRFYASFNRDKDFGIIQFYVFGKVLRNYREFYYKPGEAAKR